MAEQIESKREDRVIVVKHNSFVDILMRLWEWWSAKTPQGKLNVFRNVIIVLIVIYALTRMI